MDLKELKKGEGDLKWILMNKLKWTKNISSMATKTWWLMSGTRSQIHFHRMTEMRTLKLKAKDMQDQPQKCCYQMNLWSQCPPPRMWYYLSRRGSLSWVLPPSLLKRGPSAFTGELLLGKWNNDCNLSEILGWRCILTGRQARLIAFGYEH